jgi:hypothetical protein
MDSRVGVVTVRRAAGRRLSAGLTDLYFGFLSVQGRSGMKIGGWTLTAGGPQCTVLVPHLT